MAIMGGLLGDKTGYKVIAEELKAPESVTVRIEFSPSINPESISVPNFATVISDHPSALQLQLAAGDSTQKSIKFSFANGSEHLPILSGPAFYAAHTAYHGSPDQAAEVIAEHYHTSRSSWEFRNDCRDTLKFDSFVTVLDSLSHMDQFDTVQFRSGLGYFAKRILDDTPQAIFSINSLEERIQFWNGKEELESVSTPDVISEKLGRQYYREGLSTERKELRQIGFQPTDYDPNWKSAVPACWLAHIVINQGVQAAQEYVKNRPTPQTTNYEDAKSAAWDASFGDRGPMWGNVLALTVHTGDDFHFDAYQYLQWIAKEYRGKGKFTPLLYAAAQALAPSHIDEQKVRALEIQEHLAEGHNWRRDGAFERERDAFERAVSLARGENENEPDPSLWIDALASLTHAKAKLADSPQTEQKEYEDGIEKIEQIGEEYNLHPEEISKHVDFLREQKDYYQ